MIYIQDAIRALNSSIVTIRGDVAYDANEQKVAYDMAQAEAKLAELQAAETVAIETQATTKASALAKLSALGLTEEEALALGVK